MGTASCFSWGIWGFSIDLLISGVEWWVVGGVISVNDADDDDDVFLLKLKTPINNQYG